MECYRGKNVGLVEEYKVNVLHFFVDKSYEYRDVERSFVICFCLLYAVLLSSYRILQYNMVMENASLISNHQKRDQG